MQAPSPDSVVLQVERIRCSCQVETLIFSPQPWYIGQGTVSFEPSCVGCGKSLLAQSHPTGARVELYALAQVPADLALSIDDALATEVAEARQAEVVDPPGGLSPQRWSEPHEAPSEYTDWLARQPGPAAWVSREELRRWAIPTALVAAYTLFCILI